MVERTCSPLRASGECGFRQPLRGLRTNYPARRLCPKLLPALRPTRPLLHGPRGTPPLQMPARGPAREGSRAGLPDTPNRAPRARPPPSTPASKGRQVGGGGRVGWAPHRPGAGLGGFPSPMERPLHGWAGVCSPGQHEARPGKGMALSRETTVLDREVPPNWEPDAPHFTGIDGKVRTRLPPCPVYMSPPAWPLAPPWTVRCWD